uniref:Uncharacterized protein n=1 Tax=Periophthalmus magnuspinnatus TaxID=409849 RepID=A0A3B3ZTU6_9GOBI
MLLHRWFRLHALCRSLRERGEGWRTICGHPTAVKHSRAGLNFPPGRRFCHGALGGLYGNVSVQRYIRQLMEEFRSLDERLQRASLSEADRRAIVQKHTELLPLATVWRSVEQAFIMALSYIRLYAHGPLWNLPE